MILLTTFESKSIDMFIVVFILSQLFGMFREVATSPDSRSSYFQMQPHSLMEGEAISSTKVTDDFSCHFLCLREPRCTSLNFERNPDDNGYHLCMLFDWLVVYGKLDKVVPSHRYDFYFVPSVAKSCSHAKSLGYNESQHYLIKPDGPDGESQPIRVYCDMASNNGIGVTVVSHNSEARTEVSGCEANGCYRRDVVYDGISGDLTQLRALTSISTHCEQFIKYECVGSSLHIDASNIDFVIGWLVSRDGRHMNYWGGAPRDSGKCACGVTGSCVNNKNCNCDIHDNVWREDSGSLTNKEDLPVISLRFGDVTPPDERGYHTLGKLRCYGQA